MAKAKKTTVKAQKTPKATKTPKKVVKAVKNQVPVIDASDQIYNLMEVLIGKASDDVDAKSGTVGDFIDEVMDVSLSGLYHSLFNLKYYGGESDSIIEHVVSTLNNFDSDDEFPSYFDDDCCGDICLECAAKMALECPECKRLQEEAAAAESTEAPANPTDDSNLLN